MMAEQHADTVRGDDASLGGPSVSEHARGLIASGRGERPAQGRIVGDWDNEAMTDRELLVALVDALRPLMDPDICSPFMSAWEIDTNHGADGEEIHARIKALLQQVPVETEFGLWIDKDGTARIDGTEGDDGAR